jgi:RNA polymerase sigma-70 factor, ECF subfamily
MSRGAPVRKMGGAHTIAQNAVQGKLPRRHDKQQDSSPLLCAFAEQNDSQLVAAAQSGVNDAFEVLIRRHQEKILFIAWRFTHKREDAEDIAQQALQKAFLHVNQFQGSASFSTWLTRIAINEGLMWLRKKRTSAEVSFEALNANADDSRQLDPADCDPNPEEACMQLETRQIVSTALDSLSNRLRATIQLRELEELSTEETAEALGLPVGTIKARLFQGRKKLRSILKRHMGSTRHMRRVARREISPCGASTSVLTGMA